MIRKSLMGLIGGLVLSQGLAETTMNLGSAIPALSAKDQEGQQIDLATYGKKGFLLVFFYP
ncbi:MAG: hypothetical protein EBY81_08380, partial [Verrucomicrobia bacterium]|nr:hypothetical protein [Verrucomicrobiota bacterium]